MGSSSRNALLLLALFACDAGIPMQAAPQSPQPPTILGSPGPLTASHAKLDEPQACTSCHADESTAATVNDKCLGCHEHADLRTRIAANQGFHASPVVRGKACQSCHLEHKGRGYDLMGWKSMLGGMPGFDHDQTSWPLRGGHATRACSDCHTARNAQGLAVFMGVDRLCGTCHAKSGPHGFVRRDMFACDRCHSQQTWTPVLAQMKFNHNDRKDARVPLLGMHKDATCAGCHPAAKFNMGGATLDACGTCHATVHESKYTTAQCLLCHQGRY